MLTVVAGTHETRNAVITENFLGCQEYGHLQIRLLLEYGDGSTQSFGGGWCDRDKAGTIHGLEFLKMILETLEVVEWDSLIGQTIRVKQNDLEVIAIGHFMKEKWFEPKKDLVDKIEKPTGVYNKPIDTTQGSEIKDYTLSNNCVCGHKTEMVYCLGAATGRRYVLCRKCGNLGKDFMTDAEAISHWNNTEGKGKK